MKCIGVKDMCNLFILDPIGWGHKNGTLYWDRKPIKRGSSEFRSILIRKFQSLVIKSSDWENVYDFILSFVEENYDAIKWEYNLIAEEQYDKVTVDYIKTQKCWKAWLAILKYMYLTPDNNKKLFFVIHGPSGTGKTTYIKNTLSIIRDWKPITNGFNWLDDALDAPVAWIDELSNDDYINNKTVDIIKRLTGNADRMSLNIKGKSIKEVSNRTKLLMTFNEPSKIAQSEAPYFFDRMFYIYFDGEKYPKSNFNINIDKDTLFSMIFNASDADLVEDEKSLEHKEDWKLHCDSVRMYKQDSGDTAGSFVAYREWCKDNNYRSIGAMEFKKRWSEV